MRKVLARVYTNSPCIDGGPICARAHGDEIGANDAHSPRQQIRLFCTRFDVVISTRHLIRTGVMDHIGGAYKHGYDGGDDMASKRPRADVSFAL